MNKYTRRLSHVLALFGTLTAATHLPAIQAQTVDAAWISAASGRWTEVFRWNTFGFLPYPDNDAVDTYNVLISLDAAPTINLDTEINILNLDLRSGFITGGNTLTSELSFNWRGGGFRGGGGNMISPLTIRMNGGTKWLRGFNVFNPIETLWTDGDVISGADGVFHNQPDALFTTQFNGTWQSDQTQPLPLFNNQGTFIKEASDGRTLMEAAYSNTGQTLLETGHLEFSGPTTNDGRVHAKADTTLEFSGAFNSSETSTLLSENELLFSAPSHRADIRGTFTSQWNTRFSGREIILHPEADVESIGDTVFINRSKVHFNSDETINPRELILMDKGQILGSDVITVRERFFWSNGTQLGGEGTFFNVNLTEMPLIETTRDPRVLGNRAFVNFGRLFWTGGNLQLSEGSAVVNQIIGKFSIQGNVAALTPNGVPMPEFLNQGLLEVKSPADQVRLDFNVLNQGRIELSKTHVRFSGKLEMDRGRLQTEDTILIVPELRIRRGSQHGKMTVNGNVYLDGTLEMETFDQGWQINGILEMDRASELTVSVTQEMIEQGRSGIHVGEIGVLNGVLIMHFDEDWVPENGQRIPLITGELLLGKFSNVFPFRLNDSVTLIPIYTLNEFSLMAFHDGASEKPELSLFDLGEDLLVTWPRQHHNYRLQYKQGLGNEAWTFHRRTFVNYAIFPKENAVMFFRLVAP